MSTLIVVAEMIEISGTMDATGMGYPAESGPGAGYSSSGASHGGNLILGYIDSRLTVEGRIRH